MNGHTGRFLVDCPECLKTEGWQNAYGMAHAAKVIAHEAQTEEDIDLAMLCEAMPDDLEVIHQKNLWIMRKVWRITAKWRTA